jgi:hypothetical protein
MTLISDNFTSTSVTSDELVQLQLKYKDLQIALLQQKAAQLELEKAVEVSRMELTQVNNVLVAKYGLVPAKDSVNLQDGTITRASPAS